MFWKAVLQEEVALGTEFPMQKQKNSSKKPTGYQGAEERAHRETRLD